MIHRTPRVPRVMTVRASCGPCKGLFNVFHILRDPLGCRATPLRTRKGIDTRIDIIPHGRRIWPRGARTGPLRSRYGLFTGCLGSQNPYESRNLIMHTLKLYGPRAGSKTRTATHGAPESICPRILFLNKLLDMFTWTSLITNIHTKLRLVRKSVQGLSNDSHCGIWCRRRRVASYKVALL